MHALRKGLDVRHRDVLIEVGLVDLVDELLGLEAGVAYASLDLVEHVVNHVHLFLQTTKKALKDLQ